MGNAQMGTRGLSAADWTRLQRMRQAKAYMTTASTNEDIAGPTLPQIGYGPSFLIGKTVGSSKIRRTASSYTEYIASQTADYMLPSQAAINGTSIKNTLTKLCSCTSTVVTTDVAGCNKCGAARLRL